MKKIVVVPNPNKDKDLCVTERVIHKLASLGVSVFIDKKYGLSPDVAECYESFPDDAELVVVVGGDGSVIDASKQAIALDIPIFGVNMGRVGYLSEVDPDELDVLDRLASGKYSIKEKMLLTVTKGDEDYGVFAVNDIIVSHGSYLGISSFSLCDSLGNSLDYRADGVIFATPQGSTAYSFSSGGPVLAHDVEGILITPVCPHSFFNRSVLFNSRERISVTNNGSHAMNVAADGRLIFEIYPEERCIISCAEKKIKMLTFSENSMFTELFKKMSVTEGLK